jgi:hypothetical protein
MMKRHVNILEDYYQNEHLPLGFFINTGEGAGSNVARRGVAIFGSGYRRDGSGQGLAQKKSHQE